MALFGRERCLDAASAAVKSALGVGATEAEAVLMTEDSGLTRYAHNRIHQNVAERNTELRVRAVVGRRVAVASSNQVDPRAVRELADRAVSIARQGADDAAFAGLPAPSSAPYHEQNTYYESTAEIGPGERAQAVAQIAGLLESVSAEGFGVVTSATSELAICNSHGVHAYQPFTDGWMSLVARRNECSGYASLAHRDWSELDHESLAFRALSKTPAGRRRTLPPGQYTVVLEEDAVWEMLEFLSLGALNGLAYLEGRSLYNGRLGEKRYPGHVTLRDDPFDTRGANVSFDFEGVAKTPVSLIDAGVVRQVAYDTQTASREGRVSTGHALPAPNVHGPMPLNLVLEPGDRTRHDLIRSVDHGLLVSRFHYVNEIDPGTTMLTGMTRDGTFLIENGVLGEPVGDVRWIDSVDGLLQRTVAIGDTVRLVSGGPGYGTRFLTGSMVPALLVEDFRITGAAEGPGADTS